MTAPNAPVLLDASVDPAPELLDHPEVIDEVEAGRGLDMWKSIDDLDDQSNGLPEATPSVAPRTLFAATASGHAEAARRAQIVKRCLLEAGVPEVSIELQDGRPGSGDTWNLCKPYAVLSHHIASTPTEANPTPGLSLVKKGRPDLDGTLANGAAGVDLVYRILTMGMANHPGTGGPWTVRGPMGSFVIPKDVARPYVWGTEYEGGYSDAVWDKVYTNKRTGKSMTFREFMGRCNAGLTRAVWLINGLGKDPGSAGEHDLSGYHGEHKTWAPGRKPDRLNYTTDSGRAEIRKYNTKGDDVSAKEVWDHPINVVETSKPVKARVMLTQIHNRSQIARKNAIAAARNSEAALRQAKANREAIQTLASSLAPADGKRVLAALNVVADVPVVTADDIVLPEETDEA